MLDAGRVALTLIPLAFFGALLHYRPGDVPMVNAESHLKHQEKSQTFLQGAGFLNGADYRIRTDDLPLTRRLLYQLS